VIALAIILSMSADTPLTGVFYAAGSANVQCAVAWNDTNASASSSWTLGFWSGANAAYASKGSGGVGASLNSDGIIAAVKAECVNKPNAPLLQAATRAYVSALNNKR